MILCAYAVILIDVLTDNNIIFHSYGQVGPIAVQVQAGEFEVIASLMRYSIPHLTGWAQQVDIAMHNAISETVNGRGGGGYSGGPSAGGGGGVPF